MLDYLIRSAQLTLLGEFYPAVKLAALDDLHAAACEGDKDDTPYTLSTLPIEHLRWAFKYPEFSATLTRNGQPARIQLIGIIRDASLTGSFPYVTVIPYYHHDAVHGFSMLNFASTLDPEFDVDGELPPIRIGICRAPRRLSSYWDINSNKIQYIVNVYDQTHLQFDRPAQLVHPRLLKPNDLVVMKCIICLKANPGIGAPSYELMTDDIGLVHAARNGSNGIKIVGEEE